MSSSACACPRASDASCEALHLRLHQVHLYSSMPCAPMKPCRFAKGFDNYMFNQLEAARGKEMQSHGELVGRLEREVESFRTHQSDMQVALAKLSTERVRMEAEHQAMRVKWTQEREQHESAKAVIAGLRDEMHQREEQKLQEFRNLNDSIEKLQRQEREQLIHLFVVLAHHLRVFKQQGVLQAQLDALRTDHQLVVTARENVLQALSTQMLENSRLSEAFKAKQLEAEALYQRVQMLARVATLHKFSDELARYRDANALAQDQIKALERGLDRAIQTRNRTLAWRKREIDTATARIFHQMIFLGWRSYALGKLRRSVRAFNAQLQAKSATLSAVQSQLAVKLTETKAYLSQIRAEVAEHPSQMALFRDMCLIKLPQLLEQIQINRKQCAMAIADTEAKELAKLQTSNLLFETRRTIFKQRQRATVALLHKVKRVELSHRAFYGWKDVYLRSIVAQTTHAAMLAQHQVQSLVIHGVQATTAQDAYSLQHSKQRNHQQEIQQQQFATPRQDSKQRFYFSSLAQQQQQRALVTMAKNAYGAKCCGDEDGSDGDLIQSKPLWGCEHSSNLTATTLAAADADWKRWRRVNPVAIHKRKEGWSAVSSSLPLSPTSRMSSATQRRRRKL